MLKALFLLMLVFAGCVAYDRSHSVDLDLKPVFSVLSVLMEGKSLDLKNIPQLKEPNELNTPVSLEPVQASGPVQVDAGPSVAVNFTPSERNDRLKPAHSEVPQLVPTLTAAVPTVPPTIPAAALVPPNQELTETRNSVVADDYAAHSPCGLAPPDGIVVTAWVDGEEVSRGAVVNRSYKILVHQLDRQLAGKEISFRIGTVAADQTAMWTQGAADELNLTTISTENFLPTPDETNNSNVVKREGGLPVPPHLFVGTVTLSCVEHSGGGG